MDQVLALKQDAHGQVQLDPLAIAEAEQHRVVQHRVHVLDPDCVHWAVEHDPLHVNLAFFHLTLHD
jgi:hypothetical protein